MIYFFYADKTETPVLFSTFHVQLCNFEHTFFYNLAEFQINFKKATFSKYTLNSFDNNIRLSRRELRATTCEGRTTRPPWREPFLSSKIRALISHYRAVLPVTLHLPFNYSPLALLLQCLDFSLACTFRTPLHLQPPTTFSSSFHVQSLQDDSQSMSAPTQSWLSFSSRSHFR